MKLRYFLEILIIVLFSCTSTGCFYPNYRQKVYFPMQTEGTRSNLQFQTPMGFIELDIRSDRTIVSYPTKTGVYLVGKTKIFDYNSSLSIDPRADDLVIRTDLTGKYRWSKKIAYQDGSNTNQILSSNTYIYQVITDTNENIYFMGHTEKHRIFGKSVPKEKPYFITCLTKNGKFKWTTFFKEIAYKQSAMFDHENMLYYAFFSEPTLFTCGKIDPENGKQQVEKTISISTFEDCGGYESIYASDSSWYIAPSRWCRNTEEIHVQKISFEGNSEWVNSYPITVSKVVNKKEKNKIYQDPEFPILFKSNLSHIFITGTYNMDEKLRTNFLLAIKPDGLLDWEFNTRVARSTSILRMVCNEEAVFLVGKTSAEFLQTTTNSFQPRIKGSEDLFIQALNLRGEMMWCTYLGGTKDDLSKMKYWRKDNLQYTNISCKIENDRLVVASSTYSTDFPVVNGQSVKTNPFIIKSKKPSPDQQPPSYGMITTFDKDGRVLWSTYLTSNATKEELDKLPTSSLQLTNESFSGEQVLDIQIDNDQIYCLVQTNDTNTLLYKPQISAVSLRRTSLDQDTPIYFYIFSAFKLK